VPQDKATYGNFSDYGSPGRTTHPTVVAYTSWAGYNNLPPGYWVYVYPHWYIWRDCVKPDATLPGARQLQAPPGKLGGLQTDLIPLERPLTK
jgi:hypothetical protein